jgi:hypothetical protein
MDYKEIITKSASIFNERQSNYGSKDDLMERLCVIYTTITGEQMTPYHANMFMHCLKLVRIAPNTKNGENYWDGINYLAFAGEAAQIKDNIPVPVKVPPAATTSGTVTMTAETAIDDGIAEFAKKYAPPIDNPDSN